MKELRLGEYLLRLNHAHSQVMFPALWSAGLHFLPFSKCFTFCIRTLTEKKSRVAYLVLLETNGHHIFYLFYNVLLDIHNDWDNITNYY